MTIVSRLKYAMYVLIAVTMILMLILSVGEAVGVAHGIDVMRLTSNPFFAAPVFIGGYVVAPFLAPRMPVSGEPPLPEKKGRRQPYGYTARSLLLVLGGLALAMLANLAVFLLGKFA